MVAEQVQQITVNSSKLHEVLKRFRPLIKENPAVPAHEHILITADKVVGGNSDRIRMEENTLPVYGDFDGFCPEFKLLFELVTNCPDEPLEINFDESSCTIRASQKEYQLPVIPARDYPDPDKGKVLDEFMVAIGPELKSAVDRASDFMMKNIEYKPDMDGVWVVPTDNSTVVFASNNSMAYMDKFDDASVGTGFQIRHDATSAFISVLENGNGTFILRNTNGWMIVETGDDDSTMAMAIRRLNSSYKSMHQMFEKVAATNNIHIRLNRRDILLALKRIKAVPKDSIIGSMIELRLITEPDADVSALHIEYQYMGDYAGREYFLLDDKYPEIMWQVGLSTDDFETCLNAFKSDEVIVSLSQTLRNGIAIKASDYEDCTVLVMPKILPTFK